MIGSLRSSLESRSWESGWDWSMRRSRKPLRDGQFEVGRGLIQIEPADG